MSNQHYLPNWANLQPQVRQKWSKFTKEELELINGQKDKLITQIQKRYGIKKDQVERELQKLERRAKMEPTERGIHVEVKKKLWFWRF